MSHALSDYLQIWGLEGDTIVYRDASLGAVLELEGLDVGCYTDESCESVSQALKNFINSIPDGYSLQICQNLMQGGSMNAEKHFKELTAADSSEIAKQLAQSRYEYFKNEDSEGNLPLRRILATIRTPPIRTDRKSLLGKAKQNQPIDGSLLHQRKQNLDSVVSQCVSHLKETDIEANRLPEKRVVEEIFAIWNPGRCVGLRNYESDNIRDDIILSDLHIDRDGIAIGSKHHKVISVKTLPDLTFPCMSSCLLGLPIGTRFYFTAKRLDQNVEIEKLQTSRRIAFSMSQKPSVRDIESESKYADIENLLEELITDGERVFDCGFQFVVSADSKAEVDQKAATVLRIIQSLPGAEGIVEDLAGFQLFTDSAFPNATFSERGKKLKSTNVADLLPVYGFWKGHREPSILLKTRSGETINVDPFDKSLTNANMIVSGGSGAGKSFLTNVLMLHMLKEDPKIFIVDIGGSYKKLCDNLGGQYISLGLGKGQSINPFDLKSSETKPGPEKLKFLMSLVEMITKEDNRSALPKVDRSEIEELINRVYLEDENPSLSGLQKRLLDIVHLEHYGKILSSWVGETPYGGFLDAKTSIDLENKIVCFDLKELEAYPDLQAACLLIITDYVWRKIQSDLASKKFLIFDECWKLLENEAGSSFIANVFRTFRKYYASAIAISQNMDDFARSKVSGAVMTNSAIKWILMQKGADPKRLKETLRVNDKELQMISSLTQRRGYFSEAFLMAEASNSVVSVETTPLEYWIATTDPREMSKIGSSEPNTLKRLKQLSAEYPHGLN